MTSHVEWSLYLDNKNKDEDNEPLIELNNTADEDFRNIVDGEDWDSEDIGLVSFIIGLVSISVFICPDNPRRGRVEVQRPNRGVKENS
jgi:hypothetical protein